MTLDRRDFLKISAATSIGLWLDTILGPLKLRAAEINNSIPQMVYRPYGSTGKNVSTLGMGCMRLPYENGDPEEAVKLIVKAYELGINYFDTAPNYVKDKSEEIVGMAFREIERKNKNVKNPLPYYWTSKTSDRSADEVRKRLERSLKRIGKDKIHFYHLWCIMDADHYQDLMKKGGAYEGAMKAKEEGLIDHLVFSSHATGEENLEIINDDVFEGMLVGYNITNFPRQDQAVKRASEKNMGVVTMNPLAGGLIPKNAKYFEKKLERSNTDMSIVQTALAFIMGQPEITVALSGMTREKELIENVKTLNYLKVLSEGEVVDLKKKYLQNLEGICTTCEYCDVCPVDIPVYSIMEAYNTYILKGKEAFLDRVSHMKKRGWLDVKAEIEKCISCLACEKVCTQHLEIVSRFETIKNML
jgi:predicted aldo/keto reductase-like oxidoreductase